MEYNFIKTVTGIIFFMLVMCVNTTYALCKVPAVSFKNDRINCFFVNDTLPKQKFSKENAIALAREKGYYKEDEINTITLDSANAQWVITSEKHTQSRKRHVKAHNGICVNCRKTNGCTCVSSRTLILNATDGKIIAQKRKTIYYPNYE